MEPAGLGAVRARSSGPAATTRPATGRATRCARRSCWCTTPIRRRSASGCRSPTGPTAGCCSAAARPTISRPGLPPDHAVPAGAAPRIPGDPLPRQRARRALARGGVHPGHAARRPGCRRHRGRGHRIGRHRVGPAPHRSACGDARLHAAAQRCVRAAAERAPPGSRNPWACSRVRSNRDAARPTTSPTGRCKYGIARGGHATGARRAVSAREAARGRADHGAGTARCDSSTSTTPSCAASTTR